MARIGSRTSGSGGGSGGSSSASTLTPTATKTGAYTAVVGDLAMMNVAGGATALGLPAAPADKAQVGYRAIGATTAVPLVVTAGGSDKIGVSGATSASVVLADETVVLQYQASAARWIAVSNVKTQTSLDARYGTTLLGITESFVSLTAAGTATQQLLAVTFVSDGTPVEIEASGGSYTCTGAQAGTWDLYDAVAAKVLRQVVRTSAAAAVADDVPFLRRESVTFAVGPQTVYLRFKPTGNTGVTFNVPTASTDESPLQLTVRKAA